MVSRLNWNGNGAKKMSLFLDWCLLDPEAVTEFRSGHPASIQVFTIFLTGRFPSKFAVKWILNTPSHFAYVSTLPCETLMSAKEAINDKLQGSLATYVWCGGVVNNQIKKCLLLSVCENFFKSVNVWQSYNLQARTWLSRALCSPSQHTANRRRKYTKQSGFCWLLCQIFTDFNFFHFHQ